MATTLKWSDLELLQPLGEGHAAIVWRARLKRKFRDFTEGAHVAVKRYKSWLFEEAGQYDRIFRELQTGAAVHHPHLVRALCLVADPDRLPALVMKYYPGRTLDKQLASHRRTGRQPSLKSSLQILGRLAAALAALHKARIIHRDVKPANVVLERGMPILMDFGVVRTRRLVEQTTTTQFLGTIRYAAPEYLFGEGYNRRADVYSLGAIAYEMFANRQFYARDQQWASLIVARREEDVEWQPQDSSRIAKQHGFACLEIVLFILHHSLWEERSSLKLSSLANAVDHNFWSGSFHFNGGEIKKGIRPDPVPDHYPEFRKLSVREASALADEHLSESGRSSLLRALTSRTTWHFTGDPRAEYVREGREAGLFKAMRGSWYPHPALIAACRVGTFGTDENQGA